MPHFNILFLIADDHRADALGGLGHPAVKTPCLDQLMSEGTTFTHVFTTVPVCTPARAAILSGCDAFHNGVRWFGETLHSPAPTLPEVLRASGYHTHAIGKWHNDEATFERAFTSQRRVKHGGMWSHAMSFEEDGATVTGFSSELFADAARDFVTNPPDAPWFCYVAFTAPHDPRTPPADFHPDEESVPLPPNFMQEHPFDNGEMTVRDERLEGWPRTPEAIREHLASYYGMIAHMDAQIGRVLEALEASGQADNTIVVYTGDHGLAIGSHGLMGKQNLYDHSVRVPLILRAPMLPAAAQCDGMGYGFDLFATLCEMTEVPAPDGLDSRSLLPQLSSDAGRTRVFGAYRDLMRSIRTPRWKYIEYTTGPRRQLFDLESDPCELKDLLLPWRWQTTRWHDAEHDGSEYFTLADELRVQLRIWQQAMGDPLVMDDLSVVDNLLD